MAPPAPANATSSQRTCLRIASRVASGQHSAPRECNQTARSALHRKQSAHRAAHRPHLFSIYTMISESTTTTFACFHGLVGNCCQKDPDQEEEVGGQGETRDYLFSFCYSLALALSLSLSLALSLCLLELKRLHITKIGVEIHAFDRHAFTDRVYDP